MTLALRPYQIDALERSKEAYDRGINRQLAVLATGLGKTAIASSLKKHHGLSGRVMMLTHMDQLAQQSAKAMAAWNPGAFVGVEMAGQYAGPMDDFVVASVPTLGRKGSERIKRFARDEFQAIIQDEAHIGMADSFKRVYDHFGLMEPNPQGPLFLGITATPNRNDGQGLKALFDMIVFDMGIRDGIASGYLCDIRAVRISGQADLSGVSVRGGEFAEGELASAVNSPQRNAIVVKEWAKQAWERRTICFTANVQHALDLAEAFKVHGIEAKAVWGDDPERQHKIDSHKGGQYPVICCAQLLGIGYDDPQVSCIVLAAPRKSFVRYAQEVGRGTRIAENKPDLLVMDVCDSASKHDLCTVSSLLGLPKDLDLKGEKFTKAREQLERVAAEFPTANIQDLKNLDELATLAEKIELFKVSYPPEVARLTELAWTKQGDAYAINVNRERLTLSADLLGEWRVHGSLNGNPIDIQTQNLAGCFNAADRAILENGGVKGLLARESRWRNDGPSDKQLALCKKLNLPIPAGATRGMVSAALDSHFAQRRA
jgi:superfamily II DNA or RNA helicase